MPEFIERKKKDDVDADTKEIKAQLQKERVAKINTRARINGPVNDGDATLGFDKDGNAVTGRKQWPVFDSQEINENLSKRNLSDAQALNKQSKVDNDRELFERLLRKRLGKGVTIRKEQ